MKSFLMLSTSRKVLFTSQRRLLVVTPQSNSTSLFSLSFSPSHSVSSSPSLSTSSSLSALNSLVCSPSLNVFASPFSSSTLVSSSNRFSFNLQKRSLSDGPRFRRNFDDSFKHKKRGDGGPMYERKRSPFPKRKFEKNSSMESSHYGQKSFKTERTSSKPFRKGKTFDSSEESLSSPTEKFKRGSFRYSKVDQPDQIEERSIDIFRNSGKRPPSSSFTSRKPYRKFDDQERTFKRDKISGFIPSHNDSFIKKAIGGKFSEKSGKQDKSSLLFDENKIVDEGDTSFYGEDPFITKDDQYIDYRYQQKQESKKFVDNLKQVETFEELGVSKKIIDRLHSLGMYYPLPSQIKMIPCIMSGKDVICKYKTGSGKTLGFIIPEIIRMSDKPFQTLILVPTAELASQVYHVIQKLVNSTHPRIVQMVGSGLDLEEVLKKLKQVSPYFLVGTPPTIWKILQDPYAQEIIPQLRTMIIDEPDTIMKPLPNFVSHQQRSHYFRHVQPGALCLQKVKDINRRAQFVFTSATLDHRLKNQLRKFGSNKIPLEIKDPDIERVKVPKNLIHQYLVSSKDLKFQKLLQYLEYVKPHSVLVFVRDGTSIQKFVADIQEHGFSAQAVDQVFLAGPEQKPTEEFEKILESFKNGQVRVLVATESFSRGLDFTDLKHVVIFDATHDLQDYVHMAGRTGRLDKEGTVTSFVISSSTNALKRLERYLKITPKEISINNH